MKRVLIFSLQYYPLVGGAEVAIKEITDRVSDLEFHMVTLRYNAELPREEKIGNVYVHRIGKGKKNISFAKTFAPSFYLRKVFFVPLAAFEGLRLHRALRFDLQWAMMTYMVFPTVLMRMCGMNVPYIITLQEGDPFEHVFERFQIRLVSPLLFHGIRHASGIQAISSFLGEWARKCGYPRSPAIIPNGVDVAKFSQTFSNDDVRAMKETLGKKEGDVFLVTTSRLVRKNGIDDVIRALALLPAEVRERTTFLVYGIGPEESSLRALAREQGVEERVRFMGQIAHDDMPLMLKACDIFVRPSRSEGMGNSFIEAMAAGLPVIATQEGGIADFLFDAKRNPDKPTTGWAVDANSPQQIADAVQDILARPEFVADVRKNAFDFIHETYDWNTIARRMHALFCDTIKV